MMVNNLSNNFVNVPQLGYKRSNNASSFSRVLSNAQQDCDTTSVLYLRTENTLYSGSLGGTQTVYAEYTHDSTNEDPVVRIRGNNPDGEFDFICHINDIDPANASYAEMCALFGHLQKTGQIPSEANLYKHFNVLPCGISIRDVTQNGDVTQKMNYMTTIDKIATSQQMFSESNKVVARILLKLYQNFIDTKKENLR